MNQLFGWALQALILTVGIYLFLRFVRTTRGSRLIRGMVVSVTIGVLGLWGLAKWLELEELNYLFQSIAGYVVVIFAILFQPELRRGISQIGERQLIGRLRRRLQDDVLEEVSKAVTAMAARRHGALIAFERETPLNVYVEGGVQMDSAVARLVIETLFYPGGALHDGAVILRKDRIAAASCLFPLTKNPEFSRLRGTRHRAALGLTEETDAITVAASEESGAISVCSNGVIHENVPPAKLKQVLKATLGSGEITDGAGDDSRGWLKRSMPVFKQDMMWIASSFLIGVGILFIAHRDMSVKNPFTLRLVQRARDSVQDPQDGELALVLPDHLRLASEFRGAPLEIEVTGTRGQQIDFGAAPAGVMEFEELEPGQRLLSLSAINWRHDAIGLRYAWANDNPPQVEIERIARMTFRLEPELAVVDPTNLDPRYEVRIDEIQFDRNEITLVGPAGELDKLESNELPLRLSPIVLEPDDSSDLRDRIDIHASLASLDISIEGGELIGVTLPIVPALRDLGSVTPEVALICMDPALTAELSRWTLPDNGQTARFSILTSGLLPTTIDPASPIGQERYSAIRSFVTENLYVFVDVAELPAPGEGHAVPLRWGWRQNWRESPDSLGFDMGTLGGRESLDVRLESAAEVLLEEAPIEPEVPKTEVPKTELPNGDVNSLNDSSTSDSESGF